MRLSTKNTKTLVKCSILLIISTVVNKIYFLSLCNSPSDFFELQEQPNELKDMLPESMILKKTKNQRKCD